jgi:hypothetical protein
MLLDEQAFGRPLDNHRLLSLTLYARRACGETLSEEENAIISQLDRSDSIICLEGKGGSINISGDVDVTAVGRGTGNVSSKDFDESDNDVEAGDDLEIRSDFVSSNGTDREFDEKEFEDEVLSGQASKQQEVAKTLCDSDLFSDEGVNVRLHTALMEHYYSLS